MTEQKYEELMKDFFFFQKEKKKAGPPKETIPLIRKETLTKKKTEAFFSDLLYSRGQRTPS